MGAIGAVAKGVANVLGKAGEVGEKAARASLKSSVKMAKTTGKFAKKTLLRDATEKELQMTGLVDKISQRTFGIADKAADGSIKYKRLNKAGFGALAVGTMGISTAKQLGGPGDIGMAALGGKSGAMSRGQTSIGTNMDRFISYDGSGFVNNADAVAGGDPEILNDIAQHTFRNQAGVLGNNNLGDIVFALHNSREG